MHNMKVAFFSAIIVVTSFSFFMQKTERGGSKKTVNTWFSQTWNRCEYILLKGETHSEIFPFTNPTQVTKKVYLDSSRHSSRVPGKATLFFARNERSLEIKLPELPTPNGSKGSFNWSRTPSLSIPPGGQGYVKLTFGPDECPWGRFTPINVFFCVEGKTKNSKPLRIELGFDAKSAFLFGCSTSIGSDSAFVESLHVGLSDKRIFNLYVRCSVAGHWPLNNVSIKPESYFLKSKKWIKKKKVYNLRIKRKTDKATHKTEKITIEVFSDELGQNGLFIINVK